MKAIFIFAVCTLQQITCIELKDGETYNIALKGLTPTSENSEVYGSHINLTSISTSSISITDISPSIAFLIVQSHSFKENITLSYKRNLDIRYHVNGTNIGLMIEPKTTLPLFIMNPNFENIDVYLSIHAYFKNAPVPGGCNMEFNIIDPPFMRVWYDDHLIRVDASQGRVSINGDCDVGSVNVSHDFYKMYFSEWDHSVEGYFENLKKMLTVENILKHGSHVPELSVFAQMRRYFSVYPGTGTFYVVIAKNHDMKAAYVPIHTYGCDNCRSSIVGWLYVMMASLIGLLLNFVGFRLYAFQYYVFGLILMLLFTYTLISFIADSFLKISVYYGVLFFVFVICSMILKRQNTPLPAMMILGILIACIFYNAVPEGSLSSDSYFLLIIAGVTLATTLLPFFHFGYNLSCSFVGSFCLTILFDSLLGSYLRYILINLLRRLTVTNFDVAIIDPPYQWRDVTATIIWVVLCLLGIILHHFFSKNGYVFSSTISTGQSLFQHWNLDTESQPLFGVNRIHNYGTRNW